MNEEELFDKTGGAYLCLIHLGEDLDDLLKVESCESEVSDDLIHQLLEEGESWRERLLGLYLACLRRPDKFADSMIQCLINTRGMCIIPACAVLAVAVRDFGWKYSLEKTSSLDGELYDGEMGMALDNFHYSIGLGKKPASEIGPNYGQDYREHLEFYTSLCTA